jgi:hypothetical protein
MIIINSLEELLRTETSRRNTDLIADMVRQRTELFGELMNIYLENKEPESRRAVWVIDTISEKIPDLLIPHVSMIIDKLPEFTHDGMKRQTIRMLNRVPIPEEKLGALINICFDWLISPSESVAVKVYSMDFLYRSSQTEPDLKHELADSIEWRIKEGTPGFQNKARKILKKLYPEINRMKGQYK